MIIYNNGRRIIEFSEEKNMKVMSTHFKRKKIHKGTWMAPNGEYSNQIDHVIIETAHHKVIKKIKSCRRADINSDYFLVKVELKIQK